VEVVFEGLPNGRGCVHDLSTVGSVKNLCWGTMNECRSGESVCHGSDAVEPVRVGNRRAAWSRPTTRAQCRHREGRWRVIRSPPRIE
jgi:hypothetical protein